MAASFAISGRTLCPSIGQGREQGGGTGKSAFGVRGAIQAFREGYFKLSSRRGRELGCATEGGWQPDMAR